MFYLSGFIHQRVSRHRPRSKALSAAVHSPYRHNQSPVIPGTVPDCVTASRATCFTAHSPPPPGAAEWTDLVTLYWRATARQSTYWQIYIDIQDWQPVAPLALNPVVCRVGILCGLLMANTGGSRAHLGPDLPKTQSDLLLPPPKKKGRSV